VKYAATILTALYVVEGPLIVDYFITSGAPKNIANVTYAKRKPALLQMRFRPHL